MFFDDLGDLVRVLVVGSLAYGALVLVLRVSGKRTLAKMNAFDLVVTVALGSTLATITLSSDVALLEGLAAFGLLVTAQFLVATLSRRSRLVRTMVKAEPRLVLADGCVLGDALTDERLTAGEIHQAVRASGLGGLEDVHAVVLETDGSLSVIAHTHRGSGSALVDIRATPG